MQTATVIIVVIVSLVALVSFWVKPKGQGDQTFWDVVRNPDTMLDPEQYHQEIEKAAATLSESPTEIAQFVDRYVFEVESAEDAWPEIQILGKLGDRAYPRALEILHDPSLQERLIVLTEDVDSLPEAPINRLCEIFDQDAPPPKEAAALLAPFLQSNSKEIRQSVALIIGSIASPNTLTHLSQALTDKEHYVRSYTLMGIDRAISGNRIEESSRDDFFDLVARMWLDDPSYNTCDHIPLILLQLDGGRATLFLQNDDLLTVDFEPVWRILEAFNEHSVEVPRQQLLGIIADANQEPLEHPMGYVLKESITLLGGHRNDEDLPIFERFLSHENKQVSQGATDALYAFHRYHDLIRDPLDVIENSGWDALTTAEKHVYAIQQLDNEVNNGGFAQYFFNSSGEHWQEAQNGLAAIGAKKRLQLLSATVEKFGASPPSTDHSTRMSQLSKIARKQEDPFNEQDRAWYRTDDEHLAQLILKYNLANLDGRHKAEPADKLE